MNRERKQYVGTIMWWGTSLTETSQDLKARCPNLGPQALALAVASMFSDQSLVNVQH